MRIVAKNTDPFIVIGKISPPIAVMLRQYWRGIISSEDEIKLGNFLDAVHAQSGWIECDCRRHQVKEGPCLTICELPSGQLALRRLTKRANHDESCEFHWDQADLKSKSGGTRPDTPDFLLFKPDRGLAPARSNHVSGGESGKSERQDPLRRNLFWLLEKARLNVLDGGSVQSVDRITRLIDAAKSIPLPGTETTLGQVLWTNPDALIKGWAASTLHRLKAAGAWPSSLPAQGYLLVPVKNIEGKRLLLSGERSITVRGTLKHGGNTGCAPYMALIALRLEGSSCEAERAYLHPVRFYEHRRKEGTWKHYFDMVPVDSVEMRQTADVLAQIARRVASETRGEHKLLVERPLTPQLAHAGDPFSPDFVLHANGATAWIQVRTSDEPDYVSRKNAEREGLLQAAGEQDRVFVTDRSDTSKLDADYHLERRVFGWLRHETGTL